MSLVTALCVFLQIMSLGLVLWRVGLGFLGHAGAIFIIFAVVYHGLAEIAQAWFPGLNAYRLLVLQEQIDDWMPIVTLAIVLFALSYVICLRVMPDADTSETERWQAAKNAVLDWRILLLLTLPGYYAAVIPSESNDLGYWINGLTGQFLVFAIVLSTLTFIISQKGRFLLPAFLLQSVFLFFLGQRLVILAALIIVISVLVRYRFSIHWRNILAVFAVFGVLALGISTIRATSGRDVFRDAPLGDRLDTALVGLQTLADAQTSFGLLNSDVLGDYVYRFDGNSFPALINARIQGGSDLAGIEPFLNNFTLVVPQFLNPSKLESDLTERAEKYYFIVFYGLPVGVDFLNPLLGNIYAYGGTLLLMIFAILWGWLLARIDIWLHTSISTVSLIVGIGLVYCVTFMEQGVTVYFVTFRGLIVLAVLILGIRAVMRLLSSKPLTRVVRPSDTRVA